MISRSKDLRFSCFSYFYFNIVRWSVKWCSQTRSKIKERCNLSCSKTWGNEVNLFLAFSQGGKGLGGDEIDNYLPLEFPRSSSVGTGQHFRYFRIQLTTCLPQWMQYCSISYGLVLGLTNTAFVLSCPIRNARKTSNKAPESCLSPHRNAIHIFSDLQYGVHDGILNNGPARPFISTTVFAFSMGANPSKDTSHSRIKTHCPELLCFEALLGSLDSKWL